MGRRLGLWRTGLLSPRAGFYVVSACSHTTGILAGCAGPLSKLPPKPGLSQKGGSQPGAQWQ